VPRRDIVDRLADILGAIDRIRSYSDGLTYEQFTADTRTMEAVQ